MDTTQPTIDTPEQTTGISRRTIVAGAAWAVPAVIAVTATPAFAASGPSVSVSAPGMQAPAAGTVVVSAVVRNASGTPLAGQAVSFSGPSGTSFSPASATTNSSGSATSTMTTTNNWASPGSVITATTVSNGVTGTAPLTVLGANAYKFGDNQDSAAPGSSPLTSATQLKMAFTSPITSIVASTSTGADQFFAFALLQDGSVWSIGNNASGQLGDGTTTSRTSWAKISTLTNVVQIAAHLRGGYALLSDGSVRAWGANDNGQLGDSTTTSRTSPVSVSSLTSNVTQITAGSNNGYALLSDGTIRAWGRNDYGQLGNGSTTNSNLPVSVSGISTATQICAGAFNGYARLNDGTVRAWGMNSYGQLGNGTTTQSTTPVIVQNITTATQVAGRQTGAHALLSDGTIRSWGHTQYGQGGDGSTSAISTTPVVVQGITTASQISAGRYSGYAQLNDGTIIAWGLNDRGQLGDGTTTDRTTPVTVPGSANTTLMNNNPHTYSLYLIR